MLPELGQIAMILALLLAIAQGTLPIYGAATGNRALMAIARPAAAGQLVFLVLAFGLLTWAFMVQDFSVVYVANNSNLLLPWYYRFSAVWGAHEGSLLLWVMILAGWSAAVAAFSRQLPDAFLARVLGVMGLVSVGFLLFTILTSNPFERHLPALPDGRDLNPLLQDFGLIVHPPMLYMGYVGFAVAFAFAIAALLDPRVDLKWVKWSRPWTLVAWSFLTLGIALGSWWAYYELGWGGWWFWDPVENASFMPWLAGTALLHSQAVTEKRGAFRNWTLLLAISAFSLSLLGAFLVRSGVLTSVHAFASDPERGMFLLMFLAVVVGGSLLLYAIRAYKVEAGEAFAATSRESLILINNLLFGAATVMVLLGTLYPLFYEAMGWGNISVGPPYFAALFIPLMAPVVLLVVFGPLTRWRQDAPGRVLAHFRWPLVATGVSVMLAALLMGLAGLPLQAAIGIVACVWVLAGTAAFLARRWREAPPGKRLTGEMLGMVMAHAGIGIFVAGVFVTESTSIERDVRMAPGQSQEIRQFRFQFEGARHYEGPNFEADEGVIRVFRGEREIAKLTPQKRAYASGGQVMTEAAIHPRLMRDIYVSLGEPLGDDGAWAVRLYHKPMIRWVWLGALFMVFGGFIAAADRRYRRRVAESRAAEATAAAPEPAR
jgi:cytochrome c-type biogenesis protein CcmF